MLHFINKMFKPAVPAVPAGPAPQQQDKRGIPCPSLCLMVRHFMAYGAGGNPMGYRIAEGLAELRLWTRLELERRADSSLDLLEMAGKELSLFEGLCPEEFEAEVERLFDEITSM